MQIVKAQRKRLKARIGISGPSGSGKTYSALLFAHGIVPNWEKICVIDTEVGSSNNYSHLGEFNVLELSEPFSPEKFIEAIKVCENAWMEAIIIDSVSHEWDGKGGCLELVDVIAKAKFKGNTWAAWSEITPRHQKFIEAITQSKAHIITTSRSKTDVTLVDGKPKKVGTKDIQRDGFEYELTLMFNIDRETHLANTSKDRTSLFIDRDPFLLSEAVWEEFEKWLDSGVDVAKIEAERKEKMYENFLAELENATNKNELQQIFGKIKENAKNLTKAMADDLVERIKAMKEAFEKTETEEIPVKPVETPKSPEVTKNPPEEKTEEKPAEEVVQKPQAETPKGTEKPAEEKPLPPGATRIPKNEQAEESEFVADSAQGSSGKNLFQFYTEAIASAQSKEKLWEITKKIEQNKFIFSIEEKEILMEKIDKKTFPSDEPALEDIPF